MKIHRFIPIIIASIGWALFTGCDSDNPMGLQYKADAIGPTNQVNVLADQTVWEGAVGDSFQYYFSSPYPLLPQPEPMFDVQHFEPASLQQHPARKELRTYVVLANISDTSSRTTKLMRRDVGQKTWNRLTSDPDKHTLIGKDRWAKGQRIIYLFASTEDKLMEVIRKQYNAISDRINEFDRKQIESRLYVEGQNRSLEDSIRRSFQIALQLPGGFQRAKLKEDFTWLRWEKKESSSSLMLYSIPYRDSAQLTPAGLKRLRDTLGKKYIEGGPPNSYMQINDQDLPVYYYTRQIDGKYAIEARGIWEMNNAFLGGPFASFLIYDRPRGRLMLLDGFVFAPGEEKRDLLQNLVHIIRNVEFMPGNKEN